ncbi:alpha/beta hydrolase [Arthrobacter castelli]|uniref:alpha/beta hydrolase n=1 Tax=Arthrobacter castelli TaxID=271431 RepID=UPI0003F89699|nr:alpha/beta hydrolase-fold protein [Arthrobacter castelli]
MTEQTVDAPTVLWSRPESERAGTPLLVMLHGYGSHEHDLFGIVDSLPSAFTVASLRAPEPAGPGFAWFGLRTDMSFSLDAVKDTTREVAEWIDSVREQHSSVTLFGFSQGMCVATSLIRHRPADYAAVVALSGFVARAEGEDNADGFFADDQLAARKLPLFWGRDQEDPVIPAEAVEYSNAWLRENTNLTKVLYSNMGHGILPQELAHVTEFLRFTVLPKPG